MIIPFNPPLAPSPLPFLFPGDEAADQVGSRSACPRESRESLNATFSPRQEDGAAEKRQWVMVGGGKKEQGKIPGWRGKCGVVGSVAGLIAREIARCAASRVMRAI